MLHKKILKMLSPVEQIYWETFQKRTAFIILPIKTAEVLLKVPCMQMKSS